MIGIIPLENVTINDMKILREITSMSIAQIKKASVNRTPIRIFEVFKGKWETDRILLSIMSKKYANNQNIPYQFAIIEGLEMEEILTPKSLKIILENMRQIELETQRNSDLESGYITSPDQFEAHDKDWTTINSV